jgi:hypothetical protein
LTLPSCAEYWHIGETMIRFGRETGPSEAGVNSSGDVIVGFDFLTKPPL